MRGAVYQDYDTDTTRKEIETKFSERSHANKSSSLMTQNQIDQVI